MEVSTANYMCNSAGIGRAVDVTPRRDDVMPLNAMAISGGYISDTCRITVSDNFKMTIMGKEANGADITFDQHGKMSFRLAKPKRVIYNDPATIVYWEDGERTVVKCAPGSEFNQYVGFCAALAKKVYGTNSEVTRAAGLSKEKHREKNQCEKVDCAN